MSEMLSHCLRWISIYNPYFCENAESDITLLSTGLAARLKDGDTIVVAEGYLFEFEARGLLKMGAYVPEVVLEFPNLVREMHREFVRAGSDVVLAFTVSTSYHNDLS